MIKRIVPVHGDGPNRDAWLSLDELADVDVSSEEPAAPVEGVFAAGASAGWRAATPGRQTIRLRFHHPVHLTRIRLTFEEQAVARTQEFVLRWRAADAVNDTDIARQQFTFAPPGTTREREEYTVDLEQAIGLELSIVPDISGGESRATLEQLRLA
jgi:hypothetical protein